MRGARTWASISEEDARRRRMRCSDPPLLCPASRQRLNPILIPRFQLRKLMLESEILDAQSNRIIRYEPQSRGEAVETGKARVRWLRGRAERERAASGRGEKRTSFSSTPAGKAATWRSGENTFVSDCIRTSWHGKVKRRSNSRRNRVISSLVAGLSTKHSKNRGWHPVDPLLHVSRPEVTSYCWQDVKIQKLTK